MEGWAKALDEADLAPVAGLAGTWRRYVNTGEGSRGMVFGLGRLGPGEEVTHAHVEEEVFFVIDGEGEATWEIDGESFAAPLRKGVAFFKTSFVPHTLRCTGATPLLGVYCKI